MKMAFCGADKVAVANEAYAIAQSIKSAEGPELTANPSLLRDDIVRSVSEESSYGVNSFFTKETGEIGVVFSGGREDPFARACRMEDRRRMVEARRGRVKSRVDRMEATPENLGEALVPLRAMLMRGRSTGSPAVDQILAEGEKEVDRHLLEGGCKSPQDALLFVPKSDRLYTAIALYEVFKIPQVVYREMLIDAWTDTDYPGLLDEAVIVREMTRAGAPLVFEEDKKAFDALPSELTVYRGSRGSGKERGLSWSLSEDTARWFAARYEESTRSTVLKATVHKRNVLLYTNVREEQEVVVEARHLRNVKYLK